MGCLLVVRHVTHSGCSPPAEERHLLVCPLVFRHRDAPKGANRESKSDAPWGACSWLGMSRTFVRLRASRRATHLGVLARGSESCRTSGYFLAGRKSDAPWVPVLARGSVCDAPRGAHRQVEQSDAPRGACFLCRSRDALVVRSASRESNALSGACVLLVVNGVGTGVLTGTAALELECTGYGAALALYWSCTGSGAALELEMHWRCTGAALTLELRWSRR